VRVALQAMAAVLGGANRCIHSRDEFFSLTTEESVPDRTAHVQQIIALRLG